MNSQPAEIDSDTERDESDITLYDFNHPHHRLGSPNASLTVTGEKIASQLSLSVDTVLHVSGEISLESVEYQKKTDLISSLEANVSIFKVALDPLLVDALILLDRDLIQGLVASYFGGGTERSTGSLVRALSATERRLADRLKTCVTEAMQLIWSNSFTVASNTHSMLSPQEYVTTESEKSVVAELKYCLKCNDGESYFTVVLPWAAVKAIQRGYNTDNVNNDIENQTWCTRLQEHLENCQVDLQGQLAEAELTVQQLFNMQVGDFIPLGDPGAATFMIDNTPVFEAEIGASNGLVSANILRWLDQGDK